MRQNREQAAYYNEIDPYAAQWLRNLIAAGHIAPGDIDERSIVDVRADDLNGYTQCHFFAGIGGWSHALRLAGWPDDRPVWTGSCPCQPFSAAGQGKAADDERHLWPAWFPLIRECRPAILFGEQVEAAIGWGWLDAVFTDLEEEGYACGAAVLPACGVGAPHIRQRVWFVADARRERRQPDRHDMAGATCRGEGATWQQRVRADAGTGVANGLVADADGSRCGAGRPGEAGNRRDAPRIEPAGFCADGMGDTERPRFQEQQGLGSLPSGEARTLARQTSERTSWSDLVWLPCADGKARPTQPGIFPLAHGVPSRMGRLRAYGNAIVPQVAAKFISSWLR